MLMRERREMEKPIRPKGQKAVTAQRGWRGFVIEFALELTRVTGPKILTDKLKNERDNVPSVKDRLSFAFGETE